MGLFGFLKKQPSHSATPSVKVTFTSHEFSPEERQAQAKAELAERVRNFQKDAAGLYPYEILMLSYLEKYAAGKEPARFWEYQYGVDDVPALISSLEERGFAKDGKLTELGKSEIAKNEYVLYFHRNKYSEVSMSRMSVLVNQRPDMNFRDLLWGEYNRLTLEHMKNHEFGLYRNTKHSMYRFLLEEKRYRDAFSMLTEVIFYDLNGSASPFIAPSFIEELRSLERKIDYSDEEMINVLQHDFDGIFAPYKNFSNDEVICIIVAYCFGHDEMAEEIFNRFFKTDETRK